MSTTGGDPKQIKPKTQLHNCPFSVRIKVKDGNDFSRMFLALVAFLDLTQWCWQATPAASENHMVLGIEPRVPACKAHVPVHQVLKQPQEEPPGVHRGGK